jgi:eukaryotic-like serine/threonine-protein kinase
MTTQSEPGQALSVGVVVADTYHVTRLLGRGGMGSVWEASHLRLPGKRVAIKVLHADVAADQEALARFRREAEIASRLGHPNIVEVHDFNMLPGGQPYLVLELLVGESLDSRLRRAPVSLDDAMRIAGQVGAALAAAHREQVVHRDLKPQNVFLVRPRSGSVEAGDAAGGDLVKVLDFGISKVRGSQTVKTLDSTILGTPQYMAPEQATGNHAAVDQRTDVFALGAIVYEILAGRPAFTGENIPEVVFKVVYEHPPPLADLVPGVPRRVADAVHRALAKKQDERFPDVVSFVEQMAGVSLSTLRRSPISLVPPAPEDTASMSMPLPPGLLPTATPATGPRVEPVADALAHTVDSSRREVPVLSPPVESLPPPIDSLPPQAEPMPPQTQSRPPRRRAALLVAILVLLVAAGGTVIALVAQSGGAGEARQPARTARAPAVPEPAAVPPSAPVPAAPIPPPEAEATDPGPGEETASAEAAAEEARAERAEADERRSEAKESRAEAAERRAEAKEKAREMRQAKELELARMARARAEEDEGGDETGDEADPLAGDSSTGGVRASLVQGEQALRGGDYRQALVMAERALRHGAGAAAHALRARASCGIGDLGNAKASFVRIPRRNAILRRRVLGFCTRNGLDVGH